MKVLLEKGDIVYNKEYNGFHEIRNINGETAIISGCCSYIDDASSTISNAIISSKYLYTMKPVYKKHKFIEKCKTVGAWRATRKRRDKTSSFYIDPRVIAYYYD